MLLPLGVRRCPPAVRCGVCRGFGSGGGWLCLAPVGLRAQVRSQLLVRSCTDGWGKWEACEIGVRGFGMPPQRRCCGACPCSLGCRVTGHLVAWPNFAVTIVSPPLAGRCRVLPGTLTRAFGSTMAPQPAGRTCVVEGRMGRWEVPPLGLLVAMLHARLLAAVCVRVVEGHRVFALFWVRAVQGW